MLITKTLSSLRTREIMPKNKKIHVFANLFLRFWLCAACSGWGGGGDGTKPPPAGTREAQVVRVTALVVVSHGPRECNVDVSKLSTKVS